MAGDSWAARVGPFLRQVFTGRGWAVSELGVGSTLSRDWVPGSANFQRVAEQLNDNLSPCGDTVVSLSVGGNDLILPEAGVNAFAQNEQQVAERLGQAGSNLVTTIDAIAAIDPSARVVLPGYDLLNPTVSAACLTAAEVVAGQPGVSFDPARSNDRLIVLRQMYEQVGLARPHVEVPNLLGTTQGRPGNPDFTSLPPRAYTAADCIHLTGPVPGVSGSTAEFEEPFGFNGYEIWGSELAMVCLLYTSPSPRDS